MATDWSDLQASNSLLGEVGKLTGQGQINLDTVHAKKIEEDFANTMKGLDDMVAKIGSITDGLKAEYNEEL